MNTQTQNPDTKRTSVDLIAMTPAALDALVLGGDELEILEALADASPKTLAILGSL